MVHAPPVTHASTHYPQSSRGITSSRLYAPCFTLALFTVINEEWPLLTTICASVWAYMRIYAIFNAFCSQLYSFICVYSNSPHAKAADNRRLNDLFPLAACYFTLLASNPTSLCLRHVHTHLGKQLDIHHLLGSLVPWFLVLLSTAPGLGSNTLALGGLRPLAPFDWTIQPYSLSLT